LGEVISELFHIACAYGQGNYYLTPDKTGGIMSLLMDCKY